MPLYFKEAKTELEGVGYMGVATWMSEHISPVANEKKERSREETAIFTTVIGARTL